MSSPPETRCTRARLGSSLPAPRRARPSAPAAALAAQGGCVHEGALLAMIDRADEQPFRLRTTRYYCDCVIYLRSVILKPSRRPWCPTRPPCPTCCRPNGCRPRACPCPPSAAAFRRIPNGHNVVNVASVLLQSFGVLAVATLDRPPSAGSSPSSYGPRVFALSPSWATRPPTGCCSPGGGNDLVGKWLLAYPAFVPFDVYRRSHFAHHKDEMGPNEPDLNLYRGYPITADSHAAQAQARRRSATPAGRTSRACSARSRSENGRAVALKILAAQVHLSSALWLIVGPLVALPRALARTVDDGVARDQPAALHRRARRHDPIEGPPPHHPRRAPVPDRPGSGCAVQHRWHLAHHVDMGVPFQNLPRLHARAGRAGWVTDEIEYPSYRALWTQTRVRSAALATPRPRRPWLR